MDLLPETAAGNPKNRRDLALITFKSAPCGGRQYTQVRSESMRIARIEGSVRHYCAFSVKKARVSATTRFWKFGSRKSAEPCIEWPPAS